MEVNKHTVNKEEVEKVKTLGFILDCSNAIIPEEFVNTHFEGLELFNFFKLIDSLLKPHSAQPISKKLVLSDPPPKLELIYLSGDITDPLFLKRTFEINKGILEVSHDYFILPTTARNHKIGKKVLSACLNQYEKLGVAKISVHAGLEDGGFVWAKVGFKAINKQEVDVILKSASSQLPASEYQIAKAWYDDHYNTFPNKPFNIEDWAGLTFMIPILRGSDWHGVEISLKLTT